jgi:hypothetical protein
MHKIRFSGHVQSHITRVVGLERPQIYVKKFYFSQSAWTASGDTQHHALCDTSVARISVGHHGMYTENCTYVLFLRKVCYFWDRLCGLVVRVLGYRFGGLGSIPGTTRFYWGGGGKQVVGLERGPLSLVSTTEELLDRKVAAPV